MDSLWQEMQSKVSRIGDEISPHHFQFIAEAEVSQDSPALVIVCWHHDFFIMLATEDDHPIPGSIKP